MSMDAGLLLDIQGTALTPFSSLQGVGPSPVLPWLQSFNGELCKADAPHGADFPQSL